MSYYSFAYLWTNNFIFVFRIRCVCVCGRCSLFAGTFGQSSETHSHKSQTLLLSDMKMEIDLLFRLNTQFSVLTLACTRYECVRECRCVWLAIIGRIDNGNDADDVLLIIVFCWFSVRINVCSLLCGKWFESSVQWRVTAMLAHSRETSVNGIRQTNRKQLRSSTFELCTHHCHREKMFFFAGWVVFFLSMAMVAYRVNNTGALWLWIWKAFAILINILQLNSWRMKIVYVCTTNILGRLECCAVHHTRSHWYRLKRPTSIALQMLLIYEVGFIFTFTKPYPFLP